MVSRGFANTDYRGQWRDQIRRTKGFGDFRIIALRLGPCSRSLRVSTPRAPWRQPTEFGTRRNVRAAPHPCPAPPAARVVQSAPRHGTGRGQRDRRAAVLSRRQQAPRRHHATRAAGLYRPGIGALRRERPDRTGARRALDRDRPGPHLYLPLARSRMERRRQGDRGGCRDHPEAPRRRAIRSSRS
jgi:hypothetical protein